MAQEWFIDYGTRVDGPLSSRELAERAASGRLRPTDRVSPDRARWREAGKVKGLTFPAPGRDLQATALLSPAPDPSDDLPPTTPNPPVELPALPGYDILGPLGFGGCGVVYRARQTKLDRVVALKTVRVAGRPDAKLTARFEKEAVSLARLQHPNIVNVFDSGRVGDIVFFAMELLKGEDLAVRIAARGPVDERTAWAVARQTAAALAHAAAEGIFHRDVKPANLFLVPMPTGFGLPPDLPMVKVTDFGLAITRQDQEAAGDGRLTAAGVVLGTPAYMAPEQFKTPDVDHRADIYALGATVFHALTGNPPFPGATVWDVMVQKVKGATPDPGPAAGPESAALLADMMAADPTARIGDYAELIARIDLLPVMSGVAGGPVVSLPNLGPASPPAAAAPSGRLPGLQTTSFLPAQFADAEPPAPPRRPWKLVAAAGGGLAAVAVVAAVLAGGGKPPPAAPAHPASPTEFVPGGFQEALFDPTNVAPWVRLGPQGVSVDATDEGVKVLLVPTGARKTITPLEHYSVAVGIDLFESSGAEVAVCGPGDDVAGHPVVRLTRESVALGTRDRPNGEFVPAPGGTPVPFPSKEALAGRNPSLEVRLTWAGGHWAAAFESKPLGTLADPKPPRNPELRVLPDGGPVRLEGALIQQLVPKPAADGPP